MGGAECGGRGGGVERHKQVREPHVPAVARAEKKAGWVGRGGGKGKGFIRSISDPPSSNQPCVKIRPKRIKLYFLI